MRYAICAILLGLFCLAACSKGPAGPQPYPLRLVFVHDRALDNPAELDTIRQIARTASEHGLNGMVISARLDRLDLMGPEYLKGVRELRAIGKEYKLKIIPLCFSVGYGYSVIAHDRNLAEGLPVKDALFVVLDGEARLVADPPTGIFNGSLEKSKGDAPEGFSLTGEPGRQVFADREIFREGKTAFRLENLTGAPDSTVLLRKTVVLRRDRCYRLTCWVRTEGLLPSGCLRLEARGGDRPLNVFDPRLGPDNDWQKLTMGFNTWGYDTVTVMVGVLEAQQGKVWVDSLGLEEVGLTNVLRRPGAPLVVRGEKNGMLYEEGRDFEPVADPKLDFLFDREGPSIKLLTGSRIAAGERLRVSWYHGLMPAQRKGQVTVCMSEPGLYEIWRRQARLMHDNLAPEMYFMDMDEIRAGGTCAACTARGLTMGQILGDCFTRQEALLREVNPKAEILTWSDMLEPGHNAGDRWGKYNHLVNGLFTGSWEYVPRDLIMVSWWYDIRKESLAFLSSQGFRILGSIACEDDIQQLRDWMVDLRATPGVCGVMYTTWDRNYTQLSQFGDYVSGRTESK
jgi:hypothetical protein